MVLVLLYSIENCSDYSYVNCSSTKDIFDFINQIENTLSGNNTCTYTPVRFDYVGNNNLKPFISQDSLQKCHNINVLSFSNILKNCKQNSCQKRNIF